MAEPAFKQRSSSGSSPRRWTASPEEFKDYIRAETAAWAKVIREQKLEIGSH